MNVPTENPSLDYGRVRRYAGSVALFWNSAVYAIPVVAMSDEMDLGSIVAVPDGRSRESDIGELAGHVLGMVGLAAQIYVHAQLVSHGNKWGGYAWLAANVASIPLAIVLARRTARARNNNTLVARVKPEQPRALDGEITT